MNSECFDSFDRFVNKIIVASSAVLLLLTGCAGNYAKMANTAHGVAEQTVDFTFECDGPVSIEQLGDVQATSPGWVYTYAVRGCDQKTMVKISCSGTEWCSPYDSEIQAQRTQAEAHEDAVEDAIEESMEDWERRERREREARERIERRLRD